MEKAAIPYGACSIQLHHYMSDL